MPRMSTNRTGNVLREIYDTMFAACGPQHWWPAHSPFEVMVGAILTQHTNWKNVEIAIANLRAADLLEPQRLLATPLDQLAAFIAPAGTMRVKAKRLHAVAEFLMRTCEGDVTRLREWKLSKLRDALLSVHGIGPETADAMLLYAFALPSFVVDAYTHRIVQRHHLVPDECDYATLQNIFHDHLAVDVALWNEYHALLVHVGKTWCRPKNPDCAHCPLNGVNW